MNNDPRLLKCGDTEFCEECATWDRKRDSSDDVRFLHLNAKGRCDFYDGPAAERIKIHVPH